MIQIISAIYEGGKLILEEPLSIAEGSKVEIFIIPKGKSIKNDPEIIDESDEWTDEDLRDLTIATFKYADESEEKG